MTLDEANLVLSEADLLVGGEEVELVISRLAEEITSRLKGERPILVCVMNGGLIFSGQLLTRLAFPLEVAYLHATRYGMETCGGGIRWVVRPEQELAGRSVLLLDDILDEGVTLSAVADYCRGQGAEQVLTAVLVEKLHDRKVADGFRADFTGIKTPDRFLFGYGLDYRGYWRNAPGIYAVKGM